MKKKLQDILKDKKWHFEDETSDPYFKTTMNKIVRALMDKADNMQEQMSYVSRGIHMPRKNQKESLKIKSTATEMKKVFDRLISELNMAEEKNLWTSRYLKNWKAKGKETEKKNRIE